jgi:hypothetical protein
MAVVAVAAHAQTQVRKPSGRPELQRPTPDTVAAAPVQERSAPPAVPAGQLVLTDVPLAAAGYPEGFRFSNLSGHKDIYFPIPQGIDATLTELVLVFDDVTAYEARRSLEFLINDRSVGATVLDGKSAQRAVRIPLAGSVVRDGFLKLSLVYSGAVSQDRCVDARYVGDSITVRPESMVEFTIAATGTPSITATAQLMPQDVSILLSNPRLPPADLAAALTLNRSLTASGHKVTFYHNVESLPALSKSDDARKWVRGLIVVGALNRMADRIDPPTATPVSATNSAPVDGTLAAARIGGIPVLLVSNAASSRLGRLIGNPSLAALRDTSFASVGAVGARTGRTDRVTFDELGITPAKAEVFGRADLLATVANRSLASGTRPSGLLLDVMVAPDGSGEKAVVSAFINERLLGSTVATIGGPTRLDLTLPEGLAGAATNIRVMVQRPSAQGDCRFEPQGYPAEILGSSTVVLATSGPSAQDFSDLANLWASGVQVLVPASAATRPLAVLPELSNVLNALTGEAAAIDVAYVDPNTVPKPDGAFVAVSEQPPTGVEQRVRFDRGRVAISDRGGQTRLDVSGLTTGAVAQIVTSNSFPGLWIKPLASDGTLPVSPAISLDRGDVAFLDKTGVALAMSTGRESLLQVSYLDQRSLLNNLDRFRSWIIGGVWVVLSLIVLLLLQRAYRRRRARAAK